MVDFMKILSYFLSLLTLSCTTANVTPLIPELESHFPKDCQLAVFESPENAPEQKDSLCRIEVKVPLYPWMDHTLPEALRISQELACKHGATGIYIAKVSGNFLSSIAFKSTTQDASRNMDWMNRFLICKEYRWEWAKDQCIQPAVPAIQSDRSRLRGVGVPSE